MLSARKIVDTLLEAEEQYPMRKLGDILEVLPMDVQHTIIGWMNSEADSSSLSRAFKTALMPYKRKLARVGIEFDFFAYMLVAIRNKLRPELGSDEFGQAIAQHMAKFTTHIQPVAPEHKLTATDIFGSVSLN